MNCRNCGAPVEGGRMLCNNCVRSGAGAWVKPNKNCYGGTPAYNQQSVVPTVTSVATPVPQQEKIRSQPILEEPEKVEEIKVSTEDNFVESMEEKIVAETVNVASTKEIPKEPEHTEEQRTTVNNYAQVKKKRFKLLWKMIPSIIVVLIWVIVMGNAWGCFDTNAKAEKAAMKMIQSNLYKSMNYTESDYDMTAETVYSGSSSSGRRKIVIVRYKITSGDWEGYGGSYACQVMNGDQAMHFSVTKEMPPDHEFDIEELKILWELE